MFIFFAYYTNHLNYLTVYSIQKVTKCINWVTVTSCFIFFFTIFLCKQHTTKQRNYTWRLYYFYLRCVDMWGHIHFWSWGNTVVIGVYGFGILSISCHSHSVACKMGYFYNGCNNMQEIRALLNSLRKDVHLINDPILSLPAKIYILKP